MDKREHKRKWPTEKGLESGKVSQSDKIACVNTHTKVHSKQKIQNKNINI